MKVKFDLTESQKEALMPLFDAARDAADNGEVGGILCQAYEDGIVCKFIANEQAQRIAMSLGSDMGVTNTVKDR